MGSTLTSLVGSRLRASGTVDRRFLVAACSKAKVLEDAIWLPMPRPAVGGEDLAIFLRSKMLSLDRDQSLADAALPVEDDLATAYNLSLKVGEYFLRGGGP